MPADVTHALFLSYASQDAVAARRICDTLRAGGIEVWFDQSELKGGEAWDTSIRRQVAECALFLAVVSANTQSRREGYFRLEWKLADERTHLMAEGTPFILPVTIDGTTERGALVPKSFFAVQWTKAPGGETPRALVGRVQDLLGGETVGPVADRVPAPRTGLQRARPRVAAAAWMAVGAVVLVVAAAGVFFSRQAPNAGAGTRPPTSEKPAPAANAKAVAVLPFENLTAEPDSAYLADGIHGEVITAVGKISALTVIGRTSVLPYADVKKRNLRQIATDLGVASVVEGRVQRAGKQVRIAVELVDAQSGRQLWGNQFDSEISGVFAVQAAIAREVAGTLKATLTASEQTLIERRPTQNATAYELFLRARVQEEGLTSRTSLEQYERAVVAYQQVVAEDPAFALAYVRLTFLHGEMYWLGHLDPSPARRALAEAAMNAAARVAPEAPETHYARGLFAYYGENDWARALSNFRQAEAGLPNDPTLQTSMGFVDRRLGNWQEAERHFERAVERSPRDLYTASELATYLTYLRKYEAARLLAARLVSLFPNDNFSQEALIRSEFALRGNQAAFLKAFANVPRAERDPAGLRAAYELAIWSHDFAAADQALADPRLTGIVDRAAVLSEPVALHRALVAFVVGNRETAQRFADVAMADFSRQSWTPRQRPFVTLGIARAKAFAGRTDEAVQEMQSAATLALKLDAFSGVVALMEAGRTYAAIDRREEALATLRQLMSGLARMSPNEIRLDPLWSRLKDDPRFEEILNAAKPL